MTSNKNLGWIIFVSVLYSILTSILLHLFRTDMDPMLNAMSEYVLGECGWLMSSSFFVMSIGSISIAVVAVRMNPNNSKTSIVGGLFFLAAIGSILAGLFPADPITHSSLSYSGKIHAAGGLVRFVSLTIAIPLLSFALGRMTSWQKEAKVLKILGVLYVLLFLSTFFFLLPINLFGLGQRLFMLTSFIWMLILSIPLIQTKHCHEI